MTAPHHYDRTGERVEVEDVEGLPLGAHPAGCDSGWIEVDGDVRAVRPCPRCRPALVARLAARRGEDR